MTSCLTPLQTRRRLFWSTQPDSCGDYDICGYNCGKPGLSYEDDQGNKCGCECCPPATVDPSCLPFASNQITIATNDWLRGLIINMLYTDGRKEDTPCGYAPGSQGGHWTESYINTKIGTLLRDLPLSGSITEQLNLVAAYAQSSLQRLVDYGVATSVEVKATYQGGLTALLDIQVFGRGGVGNARVGISGQSSPNGWVWNDM